MRLVIAVACDGGDTTESSPMEKIWQLKSSSLLTLHLCFSKFKLKHERKAVLSFKTQYFLHFSL